MAVLVRRRNLQPQQPAGWSPFRELQEIQQRMGQLMEMTAPDGEQAWVPDVDVEETEDAWLFEVDLPGADKGDINVDVRENELVVTGEIKRKEREGILRRRTRRVGEFEFRATVPGHIDAENVKAELHDGVLTVRVPKAEQARSRHIEIGSGNGAAA